MYPKIQHDLLTFEFRVLAAHVNNIHAASNALAASDTTAPKSAQQHVQSTYYGLSLKTSLTSTVKRCYNIANYTQSYQRKQDILHPLQIGTKSFGSNCCTTTQSLGTQAPSWLAVLQFDSHKANS